MGVARGILNWIDKADEIKAVEKKREDEREALVFQKVKVLKNILQNLDL